MTHNCLQLHPCADEYMDIIYMIKFKDSAWTRLMRVSLNEYKWSFLPRYTTADKSRRMCIWISHALSCETGQWLLWATSFNNIPWRTTMYTSVSQVFTAEVDTFAIARSMHFSFRYCTSAELTWETHWTTCPDKCPVIREESRAGQEWVAESSVTRVKTNTVINCFQTKTVFNVPWTNKLSINSKVRHWQSLSSMQWQINRWLYTL